MEIGAPRRLVPSKCLSCGIENDVATSVDGDCSPEPGDVTVCFYCGHIMAYDDDLKLRELTREEQIAMAGDQRILAVQRARARKKLEER